MKIPLLIALGLTLLLTTACQSTPSSTSSADNPSTILLSHAPEANPQHPDVPTGDVYFEEMLSRY